MSRFDEMMPHASVSTRPPGRVPARSLEERVLSDRVALDLITADARKGFHDDARGSAIREVRRDLRMLKATVRRLTAGCDIIVQRNEVRQGDAPTPGNRGRDALHLQARADAVAVLIQETERILDQLEART